MAVDWNKIKKNYKKKHSLSNLEELMTRRKMEKIKNSDIMLLSEREASKIIAISYNKLRYLRQQGKIGFCRIGCSIKYRLSDLQKLIERGVVEVK